MKTLKTLLLVLMLMPLLGGRAYAEELNEEAAKETGLYALNELLSDEEREISGAVTADGSYDAGGAMMRLWQKFLSSVVNELRSSIGFGASLIAVALLCTLGGALCGSRNIADYIEIGGCCAAAAVTLGGVDGLIAQTVESMYRLSDYSKAALPVVFTAAAAGGAITSASVKFAAVSFALDVLMSIGQKLVIPTVYAYLAVSVANSAFPNPLMNAAARFTKWLSTIMMTGMTIAFTAYIGMTGVISSSADAAAVKTARTLISHALPVVGGMISDASAAVLAAASVIKNCAGVFGLISVCILCAGPFAVLSVKMLILRAAAAVTESMEGTRLSALFTGVSNAMGMMLGLLGCCGIMLFISLMAGMKAVSG
ncbi:MAG: hypothetical protein PUB77_01675 [Clostridiales bacterium]|nr:hypothetical protein [Clostridiales bacterium]